MIFFEDLNLADEDLLDFADGWRPSEFDREMYFPTINLPEQEIEPTTDCFVVFPQRVYGDDIEIGRDPSVKCNGGDGNPLVCPNFETGWTLVGMASCSNNVFPDFYTNIAKLNLKEWIDWSVRNYVK